MRIGVDVDDVLYPWIDTAHRICERAGITNGKAVTQWKFYRDYGCPEAQVWDVLDEATRSGELYRADPFEGVRDQLHRLVLAEHTIHLVTARGTNGNGTAHLVRKLTLDWLEDHAIPHHSVTFSADKRVVATSVFVDDSLRNYDALSNAGRLVALVDRPHNQVEGCTRKRVPDFAGFVDLVLDAWQS